MLALLVHVVIVLIVIGAIWYLVNNVVPDIGWFKQVINVVLMVFVCIYLLNLLLSVGVLDVPRLR